MGVQARIKKFTTVQTAKATLKVLPRISEEKFLRLSIVQEGLDALSYYPEGRDFLKSLLLHGRRAINRGSKSCLKKFAENLDNPELVLAGWGEEPVGDTSITTPEQRAAAWAWFFVEQDGTFGIHNRDYAHDILRASIDYYGTVAASKRENNLWGEK